MDLPKVEVWGEFNFEFDLVLKSEDNYSVGALVCKAVNKVQMPIAVACEWRRVRHERSYVIQQTGTVYQPSCEDIGAFIYVKVKPLEAAEGHNGEAEAKYGPVTMDPNLRKTLESVLVLGGSRFSCTLMTSNDRGASTQEGVLTLSRDLIDLKVYNRDGSIDSTHSISQSYSVDTPKLVLTSDTKMLTLVLEDKPLKLPLKCLTRQSRDLIVLSIRCLAMRNYLINTKAIQEVFQGESMQQAQGEQQSSLDMALELEAAVREIQNLLVVNEAATTEKNRLKRELVELEDSINETIGAYQSMLANEERMNSATAQEDEIMRLKHELDVAIVNKRKLRKKLAEANSELEQIKQDTERVSKEEREISTSAYSYIKELEAQLQAAKQELESNRSEQEPLTDEIGNFREENQELKAQLEKLRREASEENQNLKVQLEKLKKEANKAARSSFSEEELRKIRAENDTLREDNEQLLSQRTFMSRRIDSLNTQLAELEAELESAKASHEQTNLLAELEQVKLQAEQDKAALLKHINSQPADDPSFAVQALEKELAKYREQCDSLAAQLSRAQAASRRAR